MSQVFWSSLQQVAFDVASTTSTVIVGIRIIIHMWAPTRRRHR